MKYAEKLKHLAALANDMSTTEAERNTAARTLAKLLAKGPPPGEEDGDAAPAPPAATCRETPQQTSIREMELELELLRARAKERKAQSTAEELRLKKVRAAYDDWPPPSRERGWTKKQMDGILAMTEEEKDQFVHWSNTPGEPRRPPGM